MRLLIEPRPYAQPRHGTRSSRLATRCDLEIVDCPLCGGSDYDVLALPRGAGVEVEAFQVVLCRDCGLAFTNPRPTAESIGRFYPADYEPHELYRPDESWRARIRRRMERAVLRASFGYPPQPVTRVTEALAVLGRLWLRAPRQRVNWIPYRRRGELLDFGCGAGSFLCEMRQHGWSVRGLDISAAIAARVERETGIRVHVGSLPHPAVSPASFDVITMWNALEHVHDPRSVVRGAHGALRPGGLLVVGVPNFASWAARVFQQAWFGLDLPRHLVHFTPDTLSELMRLEGFQPREVRHIARDGWLRHSARAASRERSVPRWLSACRWKPLAAAIGRWSERTGQADFIRVIAQKD